MKVSVSIFDDHEMFRKGLHLLLSQVRWVDIRIDTADIDDIMEMLQDNPSDVLLFDPFGRQKCYFDLIPRFRECCPKLKLVILTESKDFEDIMTAAEYGVNGYMIKNMPFERFQLNLHDIALGAVRIEDSLGSVLFDRLSQNAQNKGLTIRQREIYDLLNKGLSNKEIADKLNISLNTARNHVSTILKKCRLNARYQVIESKQDRSKS